MAYDPARQQKIFGPKLVFETGNQLENMAGKTSFCLESTNDAKQNFILAHTECGRSKMMTDGCLVVESGAKSECADPDIVFIGHNKGFEFKSDPGSFKVSAETITLEADVEIVIQAPSIRIGFSDENGTKDITLNGKNVDANAKGGSLGDILGSSNFMSIFAGGALGGLAAAAAGIAGGAGGAAGQAGLGANGQGNSQGFAVSGGASIGDNLSVKNLEVTEKGTLGILTVTGNSTLGNVKISSGIVTASSGIVTYYGDGSNLEVDGSSLSESISSAVPAGSVFYFASSSAPTGYVKANGAELSKTAYATLFSSIGTTYGETNGSGGAGTSHFRVPDLRGEFIRGWDDGRGIDSGRSFGSTQSDEFKNHQHEFGSDDQVRTQGGYTSLGSFSYDATSNLSGGGQRCRTKNNSTNFGGSETRPRNLALLACIKY